VIFSPRSTPGSRSFRRAQDLRCASSGRIKRAIRGRGVLSGQDQDHAGGPAGRGGQEVSRSGQGGNGEARRLPRGLPARDHDLLPWPRRPWGAGHSSPDRTPARAPWDSGGHPSLHRLRDRVLDHLFPARRLRGACAKDHRHPELRGGVAVRGPVHEGFYYLLLPATVVFNGTANAFTRLLGYFPASESDDTHSEDEIRTLVTQSARQGMLERDEEGMISAVFELNDKTAREIMVPRPDVVTLPEGRASASWSRLSRMAGIAATQSTRATRPTA
jgi:hypothetical protein